MARLATLAVVALSGLLFAACSGGSFGQGGLSLPAASDGVQTVSDAADALDAHRTSASENAKAAIAVTDALGSFVRDISVDQRALASSHFSARFTRSVKEYRIERNGKWILSGSELVAREGPGVTAYCQSSAGYSLNGIPSLDETFGWESGAFDGARAADTRGSAIWSAHASGAVVQGAIGDLSIVRNGTGATCTMNEPAFVLRGGASENAFELPIAMAFHRGALSNLSVANGTFANGDALAVTTASGQPVQVNAIITRRSTQLATFRTDAKGNGTLTITSSGAQYVIADWIVVGT